MTAKRQLKFAQFIYDTFDRTQSSAVYLKLIKLQADFKYVSYMFAELFANRFHVYVAEITYDTIKMPFYLIFIHTMVYLYIFYYAVKYKQNQNIENTFFMFVKFINDHLKTHILCATNDIPNNSVKEICDYLKKLNCKRIFKNLIKHKITYILVDQITHYLDINTQLKLSEYEKQIGETFKHEIY